jgi:glycosyltransferase involved in cell wall biosynthesis
VTAWAPFFSGAERALLILLENLDPARYRPVVALGTRGELESELRDRGIATVHVPVAYTGVRTMPAFAVAVARLVRVGLSERAALVHANDVPSFQPAGYAARILRVPAVTHVRFPDSRSGFEWFLKPGFRRALFVSGALRDAALREAPSLFAEVSEVVHDGVRLPEPVSAEHRRALRQELGLPIDTTIVALTGQIAEIKGIWEFVEAAAILKAKGVAVSFAVLGDDLKGRGALRLEAERVARAKGLAEVMQFLGFKPDAPRLLPAFDVITVPSHVEPLGNATLEAMAAGLPVIGSNVGGIPEMVVPGHTGLLVPARDASALARAIECLVGDPRRATEYGAAGRRRVAEAFSVERHASQVQSIYDGVLERPRQQTL